MTTRAPRAASPRSSGSRSTKFSVLRSSHDIHDTRENTKPKIVLRVFRGLLPFVCFVVRHRGTAGRFTKSRLPGVTGLGRKPRVLDRDADCEMVQALEAVADNPEGRVHRVVVEAADTGG